ncbi:hypothetical protein E3N88_05728 [Mikania micrantha]|uniref:Uncharacterized protein n=1 Tax=Mikania micrantha TaxID=192012 RepID=A0A5N6PMH8_9ASTR|nr:hypothetical protein E3N88_05728 [Mikania micrantha]
MITPGCRYPSSDTVQAIKAQGIEWNPVADRRTIQTEIRQSQMNRYRLIWGRKDRFELRLEMQREREKLKITAQANVST